MSVSALKIKSVLQFVFLTVTLFIGKDVYSTQRLPLSSKASQIARKIALVLLDTAVKWVFIDKKIIQ